MKLGGCNIFRCLATAVAVLAAANVAPTLAFAADVAAVAPVVTPALKTIEQVTKPAEPAPDQAVSQTASQTESMRTRFVIGLEKSVAFEIQALANPNRVIIDLPDVKLHLPDANTAGPAGLVQTFRGGLSAPGRSRVVIDVMKPVVVESAKVIADPATKSYRLVLDIVTAASTMRTGDRKTWKTPPSGLGAAGLQPPMPRPAMRPDKRAARAFKPVIVLDPGHGGDDTGATKNGAVEKDVVLAFAKALRTKLEKTGDFKVVMTRDTDIFIPLNERLEIAGRHGANLFIAIHADYAQSKARGATIYSLRDSVATSLRRSSKGEASENLLTREEIEKVKMTSGDINAVRDILADLAGREVDVTKDRTNVFAKSVIETMGATTPLRDDPEQSASFRVLKTALFPSVLIELAYVTNQEDAANLKSEVWRDKVSDSIMTAVKNYFSHNLAQLPM